MAEYLEKVKEFLGGLGKGKEPEAPPPKGKGDTQIKARQMKEHEVPCFKKGKGNKASDEEYDRQLKDQEEALNNMSAEDYQKARKAFENGGGRHPDAATATERFRENFQEEQARKLEDLLKVEGIAPDIAKQQAEKQAADMMKGLDALHTPDQVAGGALNPTPTGMGSSSANRSIGGQWKQGGRIQGLDKVVSDAVKEHGKNARLNVKLKRCQ
jgi:hypothetical protein